jgi:hypothetical protein
VIVLLVALGVVAMVVTHVVLQRRLAAECRGLLEREEQRRSDAEALDEARHKVLYKQQKESARVVARSDRAVCKLADEVRGLHDQTKHYHGVVDAFFADSRVQKMFDEVNKNG